MPDYNELRRVQIFERKWDGRVSVKTETGTFGRFHQFGCGYEEFENGPGNYTTAIVELPDGEMLNIEVDLIKFTDQ